ncbi:hypothetical protein EDD37DRAFT_503685 [Exophiala viscosa]|uniref:uncharacterized protein n=1 Tax=Exophiala viscosa TaxID=2486360 RepID=UPI002192E090|nr:hypothetical protein EDD37DRAFT_503685 [Exophiala viscosa]
MPNKKKSKSRRNDPPPPPKTVDCEVCQQPIIIPKTCRHGKKLINCQGTGCSTAHIGAHENVCPGGLGQMIVRQGLFPMTFQQVRELDYDRAQRDLMLAMCIRKAIKSIERDRGKEMKYLNGMPKAEFLEHLPGLLLADKDKIMKYLDAIQVGVLSVETSGFYDDEESDTEEEKCLTPTEDE